MRFVATIALVVATAVTAAAQSPADAALQRAATAYAKVRTARASFEQTLTNPLTGNTMTARGTVVQQLPNRLSVRFTEPQGDRIVADGESVWLYLPSSAPGQVIRLPLGEMGVGSLDVVTELLDRTRERFTVSDAGTARVGRRATRVVTLVPKSPMQYRNATLWIDEADGTIRQFEVTEGTGLVRRVRLVAPRVNVAVDPAEFTFTPPKGVRVLEQTAVR